MKVLVMVLAIASCPVMARGQDVEVLLAQAEAALARGVSEEQIDSVIVSKGLGYESLIGLRIVVALERGDVVWMGYPDTRISSNGVGSSVDEVPEDRRQGSKAVIIGSDDHYFWASRGNRQMVAFDGPAFTIYQALDGSGYVKVLRSDIDDPMTTLGAVGLMALQGNSGGHVYMEHLVDRALSSITYWGFGSTLGSGDRARP